MNTQIDYVLSVFYFAIIVAFVFFRVLKLGSKANHFAIGVSMMGVARLVIAPLVGGDVSISVDLVGAGLTALMFCSSFGGVNRQGFTIVSFMIGLLTMLAGLIFAIPK